MSIIERQEGREYARAMFVSIHRYPDAFFLSSGVEALLTNLEVTATKHHGDYAAGIEDILRIARSATGKGEGK